MLKTPKLPRERTAVAEVYGKTYSKNEKKKMKDGVEKRPQTIIKH